mmetsp:Transcript_43346/g.77916  ORF Transcript_43346/g.77916 Transcript_43346/m.77916 type:complete len:123 (+) Transcript_43346:207-575(+)
MKMKLEVYTKKMFEKFQSKYLAALQDCHAKLKETRDRIEALEVRMKGSSEYGGEIGFVCHLWIGIENFGKHGLQNLQEENLIQNNTWLVFSSIDNNIKRHGQGQTNLYGGRKETGISIWNQK